MLAGNITGRVWNDTNANGLMDAGEPGMAGALVEIVRTADSIVGDDDDLVIAKVDSDPAGNYAYTTAEAGSYYLRFLPPTGGGVGYQFALANVGTDETIDSDVIVAEGRSEVLQQAAGTSLVVGAGLTETPSKLGLAFTNGGPGTQHGKAVATDAAGNIYVGGRYDGPTLDLDPGPGVANVHSKGGSEAYIAKYDASGRYIWGNSFGGEAADDVESIAVDAQGNVFLTGQVNRDPHFGPGPGAVTLSLFGQTGYVAKLDPNGNVLWAHKTPTNGPARDLALDESGAVYVTGIQMGPVGLEFHPFVWKLNTQGKTEWFVQTEEGNVTSAESIAVGGGKVYVTGRLTETLDFDPSGGVRNLTSAGQEDIYLWQLNAATGTVGNAFRIGGPKTDRGWGVAASSDGSFYLTGRFIGPVDFDPTAGVTEVTLQSETAFVAKYDATGKLAWVRTPSFGGGAGQEIAVDSMGNSWSVGSFVGSIDLDPSPDTARYFATNGNADIYVWGLNADGQLIDAFSAGGLTWDYPDDVAISPSGKRVLVAGKMEKSVDFDPGLGLYRLTALPTGPGNEFGQSSQDGFLWALGPADNFVPPPVVSRGDSYSTRENTTLTIAAPGVLANDSGGGGSLTAVIGARPEHGTVELSENGGFTYVPTTNYSGSDSFTYRAKRGELLSELATVLLTVTAANDPPSGEDKTVVTLEDTEYAFGWSDFGFRDLQDEPSNVLTAVRIVSLPAEGLLTFDGELVVAGALLPVGSAVLRYAPPANANGTSLAGFTFQVQDNGGTAGGGANLDPSPNTITIDVRSVNDSPSFIAGPNQDANDQGGEVTLPGWAREIVAGPPDEAGQTLSFVITVSEASIFSVQPAIDASGTLTYTPAVGASGLAVVTVMLQDDGGTADGGRDTSSVATIEIGIIHIDLPSGQNPEEPLDVGGDGMIAANDALDAINFLNAFGTGEVPDEMPPGWGYLDVNGDGFITAADPLDVINYLNAFGPTPPPPEIEPGGGDSGEGESAEAARDLSELVDLLAADAAQSAVRRRQRS